MNIDANDPRLTAYALGELEGPDREAVEAYINEAPEGRQYVEEVREVARLLGESFKMEQEAAPPLGPDHLGAIEAKLGAASAPQPVAATLPAPPNRRFLIGLLALAASVLVGSTALFLQAQSARKADTLAMAVSESAPRSGTYLSDDSRSMTPLAAAKNRIEAPPAELYYSRDGAAAGRPSGPVSQFGATNVLTREKASGQPGQAPSAASPAANYRVDRFSLDPNQSVGPMAGQGGAGMMGGMPGSPGTMGGMSVASDARFAGRAIRGQGQGTAKGQGQAPGQQGQAQDFGMMGMGMGGAVPGQSASLSTRGAMPGIGQASHEGRTMLGMALVESQGPASLAPSSPTSAASPARPSLGKPVERASRARSSEALGRSEAVRGLSLQEADAKPGSPAEAKKLEDNLAAADAKEEKLGEAVKPSPEPADAPALQQVEQEAAPEPAPPTGNEVYERHPDNLFVRVADEPLSTFSIDVDSAGYANVRRFLNQNTLPPVDAVRIEELVNYFPYNDPAPTGPEPLAVRVEVAGCPWSPDHRLARVALTSKPLPKEGRPLSNIVFLIDVSGSMNQPNKLPLVKASLQRLVEELGENDRVGIVVYAGASGLALPSTSCLRKAEILSAIDQLQAGGSTNGGAGIQLAYDEAVKYFIKGGSNRVVLATDGDFNVGVTNRDDLIKLIEAKRDSGVFLSVLGFGMGNLKDGQLEQLANKGNGHYAYIDSLKEAEKVLIQEMGATLNTVAKDVKFQIEFNPSKVGAYRLIGYENRLLAAQDFADDAKDAGEVGAGHHVTALYELVPPRKVEAVIPKAEGLAFQKPAEPVDSPDAMVVKLRYKLPEATTSEPFEFRVKDEGTDFANASNDFKFASSVAGFGMLLRNSPYKGSLTYPGVLELCGAALADDPSGYRKEFTELVRKAQSLTPPGR